METFKMAVALKAFTVAGGSYNCNWLVVCFEDIPKPDCPDCVTGCNCSPPLRVACADVLKDILQTESTDHTDFWERIVQLHYTEETCTSHVRSAHTRKSHADKHHFLTKPTIFLFYTCSHTLTYIFFFLSASFKNMHKYLLKYKFSGLY